MNRRQGGGGGVLPDERAHEELVVMDKISVEVLAVKNPNDENPEVLR